MVKLYISALIMLLLCSPVQGDPLLKSDKKSFIVGVENISYFPMYGLENTQGMQEKYWMRLPANMDIPFTISPCPF